MNIAIVGVGLSGSTVLRAIIEHKNFENNDRVFLFEPREQLGTGMPYELDAKDKKLNSRADQVSVLADKPNDFVEWLREHVDSEYKTTDPMASRVDFGQYLQERFSPYYLHSQVEWVRQEVSNIHVQPNSKTDSGDGLYTYRVETLEGVHTEEFQTVFFCIGYPGYQDFYELEGEENYVQNPYPLSEKLSQIDKHSRVAIIGTGSTGIDCFRYISQHSELEQPLYFLVRDKAFKIAEIYPQQKNFTFSSTLEWIEEQKAKHQGLIPLEVILDLVGRDFEANGKDFFAIHGQIHNLDLSTQRFAVETEDQNIAFIETYFSKLAGFFDQLYQLLPGEDRERFMAEYDELLDFYLGPTPFHTMQDILSAYDADKLAVLHELESIEVLKEGKFLAKAERSMRFDYIVNATGFDFTLAKGVERNALIRNLFNQNIIMDDEDGKFIAVDWPDVNVLSKRFGKMRNAFLLGLWISGTNYRNNDIPSILRVSERVSKRYMDNVFPVLRKQNS